MSQVHPFDRYAPFTDLAALNAMSDKPLRKSLRVNTLKISVDFFKKWAEEKKWHLSPVPWCAEAFYIEREDRSQALGKDLLHLLGAVYMQEAASMLPPALLHAKPGDSILDMCAAPGSKSTQLSASMQGRGVVVCNDVQEKRLWTLKSALHRCGAHNTIVTRKVGQWFAKQMTEVFDHVLCDAPCTAQGTARKDSDALDYCSMENIGKMAKLQRELLESAIHACKVGGTIVYSTCTLTPEENEGVILSLLQKFSDQIEIVDPRTSGEWIGDNGQWMNQAIQDSAIVQEWLMKEGHYALSSIRYPLLRLWPQTYDTEGFFAAVLKKVKPTKQPEPYKSVYFQEEELTAGRLRGWGEVLNEVYGTSFLLEGDRLFERNEQLVLATQDVARFPLPVQDYSLGIPFARIVGPDRLRIDHEAVTLRGGMATQNILEVDDTIVDLFLDGKDAVCDPSLKGDVILLYRGLPFGVGLAHEGKLKNRLPRWVVQKS